MNYIQFKTLLADFPVFSTEDARAVDPTFDRRRLSEWQAKGYLRKVAKNCYLFADADVDEAMLFCIANRLYRPSYVSLETALAYHGLIPETAYGITSVTTRRTYRFDTPLTHFSYRTMARRLLFGYLLLPGPVKLAGPEKALLDLLYLSPHLTDHTDFASLRIDQETFRRQVDEDRLLTQLERFRKKSLTVRTQGFLEWMRNA